MSDQELRSLLEQEIDILRQLNALSLAKKEALLKDDLDALSEIVLKEEKLTESFKEIDDACSPQVQFFLSEHADHLHFPPDIKELMVEVRQLASRLRASNQFNQDLITDALNLARFMLNSLLPTEDKTVGTYSSSGKTVNKHIVNPHLLDYKG
ncbi:MAG TPA: flagellar protein FlgN [Bacillota bacterium]|nr:flagellar protein FlgN [Bacillota bacterium]